MEEKVRARTEGPRIPDWDRGTVESEGGVGSGEDLKSVWTTGLVPGRWWWVTMCSREDG